MWQYDVLAARVGRPFEKRRGMTETPSLRQILLLKTVRSQLCSASTGFSNEDRLFTGMGQDLNGRHEMSQSSRPLDAYAAPLDLFAADAALSERLAFLRRVYVHVFASLLALAGLEYLYMTTSIGTMIFGLFGQMWWAAMLGFMVVCWVAQRLAYSGATPAVQYVGLATYVVVESIFVAPAVLFAMRFNPNLIGQAAFLTILITGALTLYVVLSRQDFSFLRNGLFLAGIALFALGLGSAIFGYSLGLLFSAGVVTLMCGYILYETSLIMHHLPTTAHVAGALMIFGSMSELFKHLIWLLSALNNDD